MLAKSLWNLSTTIRSRWHKGGRFLVKPKNLPVTWMEDHGPWPSQASTKDHGQRKNHCHYLGKMSSKAAQISGCQVLAFWKGTLKKNPMGISTNSIQLITKLKTWTNSPKNDSTIYSPLISRFLLNWGKKIVPHGSASDFSRALGIQTGHGTVAFNLPTRPSVG